MSETSSTMMPLGTKAPSFSLLDPRRKELFDFSQCEALEGYLVVFICNHCPYVKHIREAFSSVARACQKRGILTVAINSNDISRYPEDRPEKMIEEAETWGYDFPYLYDENQETAKAFTAACTPDFFLFDPGKKLIYRGQFDDSRPGNNVSTTGRDVKTAVDALLAKRPIPSDQRPSVGCGIKWKPGNEPDYLFPG